MKPYRSKRMGPRSGPGGFSFRCRGGGRFRTLSSRSVVLPRWRARTFPGDSVTTGFWASEPGGKVAPASVGELIALRCLAGPGTVENLALRPVGPGPFARLFDRGGLLSQCSPTVASVRRRSTRRGVQGLWRSWLPIRPVLKHGPRSLTCAQVTGHLRTPKAK